MYRVYAQISNFARLLAQLLQHGRGCAMDGQSVGRVLLLRRGRLDGARWPGRAWEPRARARLAEQRFWRPHLRVRHLFLCILCIYSNRALYTDNAQHYCSNCLLLLICLIFTISTDILVCTVSTYECTVYVLHFFAKEKIFSC